MEDFEKFYNKALEFLSYRTRSEKEVRDYFKIKIKKSKIKIEKSVVNKIIERLKEKKFINDEEFARQWVENRKRFKPRSERLIKLELKQKGISQEIIEGIISNDEFLISNDLDSAKKLTEKRIERVKDLPKQEIYQKLGRYLASKGFNWDTIKKAIDETLDKGV